MESFGEGAQQAFFGLTGSICGIVAYGVGTLPFVACASFGFAFGTFRWCYASLRQALVELDAYPALLRLHLDVNYPAKRFRTWGLEAFQSERFKKDSVLAQMLVVARIMAQPALDEIRSNDEKVLIEGAGPLATENGETK